MDNTIRIDEATPLRYGSYKVWYTDSYGTSNVITIFQHLTLHTRYHEYTVKLGEGRERLEDGRYAVYLDGREVKPEYPVVCFTRSESLSIKEVLEVLSGTKGISAITGDFSDCTNSTLSEELLDYKFRDVLDLLFNREENRGKIHYELNSKFVKDKETGKIEVIVPVSKHHLA